MSQSPHKPNEQSVAPHSDTTSDKSVAIQDSLPPLRDRLVGKRVGNYQLLERVGEGATAMVYRAEHAQLNRLYAVKILHPMIATRSGMRERFLREAQTVVQLEHENIISINDFAIDPEFGPYMVMEYLEGKTLKEVVGQEGPLPLPRVLSISLQVCAALSLAHFRGIIHRDLKPENIFLEHRPHMPERVKILDFGIARLVQSTSSITGDGKLIGTPLYMSPEQCRGEKELTAASDIYSYGITLYEMLTGHTPFQSHSPHKLIIDHFLAIPPDLSFSFPEELRVLQRELLAKEPEGRPQSFEVLGRRLRDAMEQTQVGSSFSMFTTLEDAQIPLILLQQVRESQESPHLQLAPHAMAGTASQAQSTMLYHEAIPDSRPSLLAPPPQARTQEQLPVMREQDAREPLESQSSISSQAPVSPSRRPVVVKRRTPAPDTKQESQDPLLNDLEQLFSHPTPVDSRVPSPAATVWDVPSRGLEEQKPPPSVSSIQQKLPSSASSGDSALSTQQKLPSSASSGDSALSTQQEIRQVGSEEVPSSAEKEPHLMFQSASRPSAAQASSYDPTSTLSWSASEPVIQLEQQKLPPTRPPFTTSLPSELPSSSPEITPPPLFSSSQASEPVVFTHTVSQASEPVVSTHAVGPEVNSKVRTGDPIRSVVDEAELLTNKESALTSLNPYEEALFGLDSLTEIDRTYGYSSRAKTLSQRWWIWLLLFCAFGISVYLLYTAWVGPTLPPIIVG